MKLNDGKMHLCWECSRAMDNTCEFHNKHHEIDGMKYKKHIVDCVDRYRPNTRQHYEARKITECPCFVDNTECLSCAFEKTCLVVVPIGVECNKFKRKQRCIE